MSNAAVVRALYRGLLRWGRRGQGVPLAIKPVDLEAISPALAQAAVAELSESTNVTSLAQWGFRRQARLEGQDQEDALDDGLRAMRVLSLDYGKTLRAMVASRHAHADRSNISFSVGQVVWHKKFMYRGVITGWDPECNREPLWAHTVGVRYNQPFYRVLPDEADCLAQFGQVRMAKYCGQENLEPLASDQQARRVQHRNMHAFFDAYSPSLGRYIPNEVLQFEYPDHYECDDKEECEQDANILMQPEPAESQCSAYLVPSPQEKVYEEV